MANNIKEQQDILNKLNIHVLNPMQEEAIAAIESTTNTILLSPTGTGKTLAFLLPIIKTLDPDSKEVQALIIVPSRELAIQIEQVMRSMGSGFKVNAVYGGRPMSKDKIEIKHVPAISIGTPGRIADHFSNDRFSKKSIKDFSLEFYKIGDSLLDVANESLILEAKKFSEFKNRQYYEVTFEIDSDLYDHVQFYLRSGDKNYTILAVAFIKEMSLNQCLVRKAKLNIEWNKKFSKQYFITDKKPIEWDKTGKSITDTDQYTFYDSSIARISCRDWSEKMKKDYDYGDDLRVSYESADITSWMKNGYR